MSKHTPGPWKSNHLKSDAPATRDDPGYFVVSGPILIRLGSVADTFNRDHCISPSEDQANAHLIAAAPELLAALEDPTWLVWSNEHSAWWGPRCRGYYTEIESAGRYTLEEAMKHCESRSPADNPPELIQPSPEWIAARKAAIAKAEGRS